MSKITESDYRLPVIHAMIDIEELGSGRTKPRIIQGMDVNTLQRDSYVVKLSGSTEMTLQSCCNELISSWIAKELGLPVPEPVLVEISPEFVETLRGNSCYQVATQSIGLNFGCRYEPTYATAQISNIQITDKAYFKANGVYGFDALTTNGDRRPMKANLLVNQDGLLMIDHEMAFSFLAIIPFLRNRTPWLFQDLDEKLIREHLFHSHYKQRGHDFSSVIAEYECLNEAFFNKVKELLPEEWGDGNLNDITTYISGIVDNHRTFAGQFNAVINS